MQQDCRRPSLRCYPFEAFLNQPGRHVKPCVGVPEAGHKACQEQYERGHHGWGPWPALSHTRQVGTQALKPDPSNNPNPVACSWRKESVWLQVQDYGNATDAPRQQLVLKEAYQSYLRVGGPGAFSLYS